MTSMTTRIADHLNAWKAFQVAPEGMPSMQAEAHMAETLDALLSTPAKSFDDVRAFYRHLDWYEKEERDQAEPQVVAALANIKMLAASIPSFGAEVFA